MTTTIFRTSADDYLLWDVSTYSGLLEDCTSFTVHQVTDSDGNHCYQLRDAYGDAQGEPWYYWADVIADTVDAIWQQQSATEG